MANQALKMAAALKESPVEYLNFRITENIAKYDLEKIF